MRALRFPGLGVIAILAACSSTRVARVERPPVAGDTIPPRLAPIGDDEMTLFGTDPLIRTRARMHDAQDLLRRYCEARGRYPDSLAEALPASRREWAAVYDFDAWDRPLRYIRSGVTYELRSAGSDGRFDTADDVIGTSTTLQIPRHDVVAVPQNNPCATAPAPGSQS